MNNFLIAYINQHEFLLISFFESFVTCNVIKIAWVADVNNFSMTLRYFILITTYATMCIKNETCLHTTQKCFLPSIIGKNVVRV